MLLQLWPSKLEFCSIFLTLFLFSWTERDIMEKLRPYWDLQIWKVDGHSYNNLIELHQINCKNCWRIPALGQLPSLRTLTIEGLESVVAIGSEFFHGDDSTSLVPFPSLQTLHFETMISWEEWNSIDMDAFPILCILRFRDCPKLIGNLPHKLRSLKNLEIDRCPLLASSIPNCSYLSELVIVKSPNLVLQERISTFCKPSNSFRYANVGAST